MIVTTGSEGRLIKAWLGNQEDFKVGVNIEEGAWKQACSATELPFLYKWLALMPDAHQGFGVPIGSVLPTVGVVIPNAVGVDIGCGMLAHRTNLKELDTPTLEKIATLIRRDIPVGFAHRSLANVGLLPIPIPEGSGSLVSNTDLNDASKQLGTLGGGNHFIEIQKGSDGFIWIMIHSGSRHIGNEVAKYHNNKAIALNKQWFSKVEKESELSFLPLDTEEGQAYMKDMEWCVAFAVSNRDYMMSVIFSLMAEIGLDVTSEQVVSTKHNYASMENHYGNNVVVHRKGAVLARAGKLVCIPGSMGTASYIAEGLGNQESFMSCSHGSGRSLGRKEAQRTLDLATEQAKMTGIVHQMNDQKNLEEAPSAYKDIENVMALQSNLVTPVVKLTPLAVVKG